MKTIKKFLTTEVFISQTRSKSKISPKEEFKVQKLNFFQISSLMGNQIFSTKNSSPSAYFLQYDINILKF